MLTAVDHVQLAAPPDSEDRLRAYYTDVLGMTEIPKPPVLAARGGCWFAAGPVQLHLGVEEDFRPARKAHPGLRVTDIEAYASRLRERGPRWSGTTTCRATAASTPRTPSATGSNSWNGTAPNRRHWNLAHRTYRPAPHDGAPSPDLR